MSTKHLFFVALSFAGLMGFAQAQIVVNTGSSSRAPLDASSTTIESMYDAPVTSADLLLDRPFTTSITTVTDNGFPISGINDGQYSTFDGSNAGTTVGGSSHDAFFGASMGVQMGGSIGNTLDSSPTVTFTLDTSIYTSGYTLTSFTSDYGWLDRPPFSDQDYKIYYSTVSQPTDFVLLATVNYNPFSPSGTDNGNTGGGGSNSSLVTVLNLGVSNVGAVKIQFLPYNDGTNTASGQVVREMELFGTPTPAPEPSTYALMGVGLLVIVAARRWVRVAT